MKSLHVVVNNFPYIITKRYALCQLTYAAIGRHI